MPAIPSTAKGTDRNRAALDALALAAARQATTFVFICDAQLRPCFLNWAGREMLGLSADADIGNYEIPDFFTPKHRPIVETVALPAVLHNGRWEGELCFRHFTESSRETEVGWSAFALRDEAGGLIGAVAFTTDISRCHREEGAPRDKEFGLSADEMLGRIFADLDCPSDLADRLNGHIDHFPSHRATVEDVFYDSSTRYAAHFDFLVGPGWREDGSGELVVGVSRDISEHRSIEAELRKSEARLRAATELVGIGVYSWDPLTGALEWDERLRAMWGLPAHAEVNMNVFEAGVHPDDLPRVRRAIAACIDPGGDGRYDIEYRVLGRDDGVTRHIATSGQTTFSQGRAVGFIGAAIEVTEQRRNEAAVRASEAQFRGFAEHSSNLIWIGDPGRDTIIYCSAAYERIWGVPCPKAPTAFAQWIEDVHPDDRRQVEHALGTVKAGEIVQFEYRIVRPADGTIRSLRETSFPILDEHGAVARIGGITEDLTRDEVRQAYVVCGWAAAAHRLAAIVRAEGYRVRVFASGSAFLDVAPVLAPGCVLVDLRSARDEGLSVPRELRARSIPLPTIALDAQGADIDGAVAAMKAGATDYVILADEASCRTTLAAAMAECLGAVRPATCDENASARIARLTPREREVLIGLVDSGTNKSIGRKLGISPRTVELHRAQVMNRLNASSLTELLQIALIAGIARSPRVSR